jgi:flagellar basal-body rod protein FlgG
MNVQQHKLDTISNNLANVDTTGFKKSRNEFADLFYVYAKDTGAPESSTNNASGPVYTGLGVKEVRTTKIFSEGNLEETKRALDVAINGNGFFQVTLVDGTTGYTRDGALHLKNGDLYTSAGYRIDGPSGIPNSNVDISSVGEISVGGVNYGELTVYDFVNPEGLKSIGDNLYVPSDSSGAATEVVLGLQNTTLEQKFLEKSNVNAVQEMVNMISAQRAYELNSKSITTADSMLQTVNSLKR